jgi:DNA-binding CsgD family transcriptional regulator
MLPDASRSLTKRQAAVMERIDRRVPIKVIAQDLGVSETRINQHIRALKDLYEADSLGDLVEKYRSDNAASDAETSDGGPSENQKASPPAPPLSEDAYSFSQLPNSVFGFDNGGRDAAGAIEFNDASPMIQRAPWLMPGEPKVVPGMLDGEHAVTLRLVAIVGIAFGFLAAVVLAATAAIMISEALSERAAIPVDEQGFT